MDEERATFDQAVRVLEMLKKTPGEQIQKMIESGLLTDLRDADFDAMAPEARERIRSLLGLQPLVAPAPPARAGCAGRVRQAVQKKQPLLRLVGTVSVPAMPALGKVKDVFKVDASESARVKISYVDSDFLAWFGEMDISDFAGSELCCQMLMKDAKDSKILQALGGKNKAETGLSEIYRLMEQQSDGGAGILLADGKANIFYVRDRSGTLRAVLVFRFGRGWFVRASGIDRDDWDSHRRVFSRNFL